MDALSPPTIPVTPMMQRYLDLRALRGQRDAGGKVTKGLLDQHLEKAEETATSSGVAKLADDYSESVRIASEFFVPENVKDERFFGPDRPPLNHEPGTASTNQVGALFQRYEKEAWKVAGARELDFWFLDRELVVTQARGLRFANGRLSSHGPRIDLLLAAMDGTPIVGELKVAGDSSPYLALIQALASAAYLTPKLQRRRLKHHDQLDRLSDGVETCDVYLVVALELECSKLRQKILEVTSELSSRLAPQLASSVRKIAAIRLSYTPEKERDGRGADRIFSADSR